MIAECTPIQMKFQGLGRRKVQAGFDGAHLSSGGGSLLLRALDARFTYIERFPACFTDHRDAEMYEKIHRARGEMENRIKEQPIDLFANRTSCNTMGANQLSLWFSSMAYVLTNHLRSTAPCGNRDVSGRVRHHSDQAVQDSRNPQDRRAPHGYIPAHGLSL